MSTFFQSYLLAWLYLSDFALGAIPLLLIYHLTGGAWGASTRRILEALSGTVAWVAAGFIPVLIRMAKIYPWLGEAAHDAEVRHKHLYLHPATFAVRAALYFACWILLSRGALRDRDPNRLKRLAGFGLLLLAYVASFASIDWQMSVEPKWYSTIYGMVYGIAQLLSSFAFVVVVFTKLAEERGIVFPEKTLRDLGNILLMLVMVWTYLSFMQYLVIWSGNLPHEAIWYLHRTQHGWQWVGGLIFILQFGAPFALLLFRESKDEPRRLRRIAAGILITRALDHWWMLTPGLTSGKFHFPWLALPIGALLGWLWLGRFRSALRGTDLFAIEDRDWPLSEKSAERQRLAVGNAD